MTCTVNRLRSVGYPFFASFCCQEQVPWWLVGMMRNHGSLENGGKAVFCGAVNRRLITGADLPKRPLALTEP